MSSAFLYGWTCVQPVCRFLQLSRHPFPLTIFPFQCVAAQLPWFTSLCNTYTIFLHSSALNSDLWRRHCDGLTIKVIISRQEATSQVRDRQLWDRRCSQRCCEDSVFLGCDAVWGEQFPTFSHIPEQWNLQTGNFLRMKRFWATFAWSEAGWCRGLRLVPQLFLFIYFFFYAKAEQSDFRHTRVTVTTADQRCSVLSSLRTNHSRVPPGTASIWNMQFVLSD